MAFVKVDYIQTVFAWGGYAEEGGMPYYHFAADQGGDRIQAACGFSAEVEECEIRDVRDLAGAEGEYYQVCSKCKCAIVHLGPMPVAPVSLPALHNLFADYGLALQGAQIRDLEDDPETVRLQERADDYGRRIIWIRQLATGWHEQHKLWFRSGEK
jgi:hypothetical protein